MFAYMIPGWQGELRTQKYECETQGHNYTGILYMDKLEILCFHSFIWKLRFNLCIPIIFQLRSSRNFCIDIILLCLILGIAAYLYK